MKEIDLLFFMCDRNVEVARDVAEVMGVVEIVFVLVGDDSVDGGFADIREEEHERTDDLGIWCLDVNPKSFVLIR